MSFAKDLQNKLGSHKTGEVLLKIILIFLINNIQIQELILDQLSTLDNFPNLKKAQIVRNNIINIYFRLNSIRTN